VKVPCDVCHGQRFSPETLAVSWRGKSIGDVLQMEIDEAVEFFASMPHIARPLQLMKDVGLGYLTLGQPSPKKRVRGPTARRFEGVVLQWVEDVVVQDLTFACFDPGLFPLAAMNAPIFWQLSNALLILPKVSADSEAIQGEVVWQGFIHCYIGTAGRSDDALQPWFQAVTNLRHHFERVNGLQLA